MATQFQQRLIGTVIIVAIGVIFLPDLLSGKKQLEPDEAVTIPLRPPLDSAQQAIMPPPRPGTEAAGRAAEAAQQVAAAAEQLAAQQAAKQEAVLASQPAAEVWTIEQAQEALPVAPKPAPQPQAVAAQPAIQQPVVQQPVVQQIAPQPVPQPVVKQAAPQPAPQPVQQQVAKPVPQAAPQPVAQPRLVAGQIQQIEPRQLTPQQAQQGASQPVSQPQRQPQPISQAPASQGGSFVVQLGAFRNAANVNALVQKLRAAGYNAQTTPSPAREGELNRVWVGPDSKDRLDQQLPALQRLTGLSGSVRPK
ncbi:MAG: SPOR domain-containing protein [Candidatus Oceanisphaera merdipullorum]|nr:SPOR domain-containing protein [Candidatus Oceanisphaera merdipullorum]